MKILDVADVDHSFYMVGRRGKEGGIMTQCDMVNLQKSSQGSRGLSVLVARGKEMLDRQSN